MGGVGALWKPGQKYRYASPLRYDLTSRPVMSQYRLGGYGEGGASMLESAATMELDNLMLPLFTFFHWSMYL